MPKILNLHEEKIPVIVIKENVIKWLYNDTALPLCVNVLRGSAVHACVYRSRRIL